MIPFAAVIGVIAVSIGAVMARNPVGRTAFALLSFLCAGGILALPVLAADGVTHQGHATGGRGLAASAVFDTEGTLWIVHKEGAHALVRASHDQGRTWTAPTVVNAQPETIAAEGEARPKIAAGLNGELYVSWTRPLSKPYTGEIRFARSVDGGRTFSAPLTVHTDRQEITHRFDALAVGAGGQVYLAWIDKRDQEQARRDGVAYAGAALYLAISDDAGAHFRGDYKIADHSCECCRIALVPQPDGGLLAFWRHVFDGGIRDHALARVDGDGATVSMQRATFDEWRIDACPHHGPSLAQDAAGALHAVWFTQGPGREGVHYAQLTTDGPRLQRQVGGETAAHADVAVAGERVVVVWTEFDGHSGRLMSLTSTDGGRQWRERELAATEGPYDQPRLLRNANEIYVLWNRADQPLSIVPTP